MTEISSSILAADLSALADEISTIDTTDRIHIDIMDGHFVSNISFGFPVVKAVQKCTPLPIDVHFMGTNPLDHLDRLTSLQIDSVTVHIEATGSVTELTDALEDRGIETGIAINPSTEISELTKHFDLFDRITVMGVEPGFSGKEFQRVALDRLEYLNSTYQGKLEIDGGITVRAAQQSADAGADIVVSGSTIFDSQDRSRVINNLRSAVDQ